MAKLAKRRTIDDYLAGLRPAQRAALEKVRRAVRAAAPRAEEGWSYGVPAFRLDGKPIAGFAATASHCSYYPMSGAIVAAHEAELAGCDKSKGAIRFPPDAAPSAGLIRRLVKARIAAAVRGLRPAAPRAAARRGMPATGRGRRRA